MSNNIISTAAAQRDNYKQETSAKNQLKMYSHGIALTILSALLACVIAIEEPAHEYSGKRTTVYQIGRVCTYNYPHHYLTLVFKYCEKYAPYNPTLVLTGPKPVYQHWVKVFDDDLRRSNKFHLVSFPFLDYAVKVSDVKPHGSASGGSLYALTAVRLPPGFYVHGAAFKQLGPEFIFQDTVSYTNGTVQGTWNYIKHVQSGYYLDCLIGSPHAPECATVHNYDPVYMSADAAPPATISGGSCTCTVNRKQWRYLD